MMTVSALGLVGCAEVGPDYVRPTAPVTATYKEFKGWKAASPRDSAPKGAWWKAFHDPELDRLEAQVAVSNQTLKADEANYRVALALVAEARAGLFPIVNVNASASRSSPGVDQFVAELQASWAPDFWGKVRREIEEQGDAVQASAATLANATLMEQSLLATAYVTLRESDSARQLYDDTVKQYQRSLDITQNQYNSGVAAKSDVITAQAQVLATQALLVETDVTRHTSEHAIAVLMGRPPAELNIPRGTLADSTPNIPPGVPSTLLERRPDIAAAERTIASDNAAIGVAIAGYYPDITLSGLFGYSGNPFLAHGSVGNPVWSYALTLMQPVFNGGLTDAQVAAARAAYESQVAIYRQTVLTSFQQVEDGLSSVRIYGETIRIQIQAVASAEQAVQIALNEYKAGTQSFTTVVTAEATALSDQQSLLSSRANRLQAAVNLIVALGGGWSEAKLPSTQAVGACHVSLLPLAGEGARSVDEGCVPGSRV